MTYRGRSDCRLMLIVVLIGACGCSAVRNEHYAIKQTLRAHQAWRSFDTGVVVSIHSIDYASGWKSGFYSVLTGGDGRPPVLPPRRYWDPPFLCHPDPQGLREWRAGFQCGAATALKEPSQHFVRSLAVPCQHHQTTVFHHSLNPPVPVSVPILDANHGEKSSLSGEPPTLPLGGHSFPYDVELSGKPPEAPTDQKFSPPVSIRLIPEISPLPSRDFPPALRLNSGIGDGQ